MSTSYLKKACWMIATISGNIVADINETFQILDPELHEVIANAFRKGISDEELKKYNGLMNCHNTIETFKTICNRNKNLKEICDIIEIHNVTNYLEGESKNVLVVYNKFQQKQSLKNLDSQYKLIFSIEKNQVRSLFNKTWHECNDKAIALKGSKYEFGLILVYLKKHSKPLKDVQVKFSSYNNEFGPESRRDISNKFAIPIRALSIPDPQVQKRQRLDNSPQIGEIKYHNIDLREKNYELNQNYSIKINEQNKYNYSENGFSPANIKAPETYTSEIVEKLTEKFEGQLKNLTERVWDALTKSEEKIDRLANDQERLVKNYENFTKILDEFSNKLKEPDQLTRINKLKKPRSPNNNFNLEEIAEKVRVKINDSLESAISASNTEIICTMDKLEQRINSIELSKRTYNNLESIINQNYQKLYNLYLEIKSTKESSISNSDIIEILKVEYAKRTNLTEIENSLKEYTDKEIKSIKNELNSNFHLMSSSVKKELDTKKVELNSSIEEIGNQINAIDKLSKTNKSDIEKLCTQSANLNTRFLRVNDGIENISNNSNINKKEIAELARCQELASKKLKIIEEEIKKYKSEIFRQSFISSNEPQAALRINASLTSQTETQPPRRSIDPHNHQQIKNPLRSTQVKTLPARSQVYSKSGLKNIGNTCYMNSVIQILASISEFKKYIGSISGDQLLQSLYTVTSLMNINATESQIIPHINQFKDIISVEYPIYEWIAPNDSKELFAIISDRAKDANLFTVIKRQIFTCTRKHKSLTNELSSFIYIPENCQNNIREFLNKIVGEKNYFYGTNKLICDECGELRDITLETESVDWPNILAIYIPNCKHDIELAEELKIGEETYQIFGVICYYGFHFIAFTKNSENEWEKYDDSRVSKNEPDWNRLNLAFYKKY